MQKIIIAGNLTADPTFRNVSYSSDSIDPATGEVTKTGVKAKVCNFTVAADSGRGQYKTTTFFRVSAWDGLADVCSTYLKKGRAVNVIGTVKINTYLNKEKKMVSVMEIRADEVQFFSNGKDGGLETETVPVGYVDDGMPC